MGQSQGGPDVGLVFLKYELKLDFSLFRQTLKLLHWKCGVLCSCLCELSDSLPYITSFMKTL